MFKNIWLKTFIFFIVTIKSQYETHKYLCILFLMIWEFIKTAFIVGTY